MQPFIRRATGDAELVLQPLDEPAGVRTSETTLEFEGGVVLTASESDLDATAERLHLALLDPRAVSQRDLDPRFLPLAIDVSFRDDPETHVVFEALSSVSVPMPPEAAELHESLYGPDTSLVYHLVETPTDLPGATLERSGLLKQSATHLTYHVKRFCAVAPAPNIGKLGATRLRVEENPGERNIPLDDRCSCVAKVGPQDCLFSGHKINGQREDVVGGNAENKKTIENHLGIHEGESAALTAVIRRVIEVNKVIQDDECTISAISPPGFL